MEKCTFGHCFAFSDDENIRVGIEEGLLNIAYKISLDYKKLRAGQEKIGIWSPSHSCTITIDFDFDFISDGVKVTVLFCFRESEICILNTVSAEVTLAPSNLAFSGSILHILFSSSRHCLTK